MSHLKLTGVVCRTSWMLGAATLLAISASAADETNATKKTVTFTKDVAPIFQAKCEECHRKGTGAPMTLTTFEEARPWAKSIKQRVATRTMPPWHLDKTSGIQHFANDRSLNDDQIATIVAWVDGGSLKGDPKDMPAAKKWPDGEEWILAKQFGEPGIVLKSEPYTMPAHGQDVWFKPLTSVDIKEPRWVRAVEIRPGTPAGRKIMHHVLARLQQDEPGLVQTADDAAANAGGGNAPGGNGPGLLMEWAIGKNYDIYRPNTGKLLLPGSHIWWELHLHAVGEEIRDHAELAVYFYPKGEEPKYRTRLALFSGMSQQNRGLDIAPNSIAETTGYTLLRSPARLENYQPHMHLRGKAMSMEAILPDGTVQLLSYVNNFNFNWMNNYIYADDAAPVLPKGTIIKITGWYDNTSANPHNPDPNQWVGFGDRTVDEMSHAWVNVTNITEEDYKEWAAKHKPERPAFGRTAQQQ
ncbi:MAG TPA: cytochrome c [Bryobacteraceae bacterium]|nr:cytochrome c [Bryobacteraceae bacterium]